MTIENNQEEEARQSAALFADKRPWMAIAVLFLVSAVFFAVDRYRNAVPNHYEIAAPAPQFQLIGRLTGIHMKSPPALFENGVFFLGSVDGGEETSLIGMNLSTGQIRWQIDDDTRSRPQFWPQELSWRWNWDWQGLLLSGDYLYFADAVWLQTTVTAFDAPAGSEVWRSKLGTLNGSNVDYMMAADGQLNVRINEERVDTFYGIDAATGMREIKQVRDSEWIFMMEKEPLRVYEALPNAVRVSGRFPWQVRVGGCGTSPLVHDAFIIVRVQACESPFAQVVVLDRENGLLVWQGRHSVVSNLALAFPYLYFLTEETTLTAVDVTSGQIAGTIAFTPQIRPSGETPIYVAAHQNRVALYFGGTQQLFAFSFFTQLEEGAGDG